MIKRKIRKLSSGKPKRIKRWIKRVAKKLRMVHTKERKNLSKNQDVEKVATKKMNEYYRIKSHENFNKLSQVDDFGDEEYPSFAPEETKFNRYLKDLANEKMEEPFRELLMSELQRDPLMSEAAEIQNRINAEEWEKFSIDFYEKNETKRLLEEQKYDQDNILARFKGYKGDNVDIQEKIFDRLDMIDYQLGARPEDKMIEFNPYNEYIGQIEDMKNEKILDVINFENKNEKLSKLIESGFLDRGKSLAEVIRMMKFLEENSSKQKPEIVEEEYIEYSADGTLKEITSSKPKDSNIEQISKNFTQLVKSEEDKELLSLVLSSRNRINNSGGLQYNAKYSDIFYYLKDFLKTDEETRLAVQESVEKIGAIRGYEESLLENKHIGNLERRGEPLFSKLDSQEKIAYIKHEVNYFEDIFKVVKIYGESLKEDRPLTQALVEKLALTHSLKNMFYKDNDYVDLTIISQEEYKTLFKLIMNNLHEYSFKDLSQVLYSLGELHWREGGQLMPELYTKGLQKALLVTNMMIEKVYDVLTTEDLMDEETKSDIVKTLGVALEGMLRLGMVNQSLPDAFMNNSIELLKISTPLVKESYTFNRILEFSLRISKLRKLNLKDDLRNVIFPLITNGKKFVPLMVRRDLSALVLNLNSLVRQNKVLEIPENLIKEITEELKTPFFNRYKNEVTVRQLERLSTLLTAVNNFDQGSKGKIMKIVDKRIIRGFPIMGDSLPIIFQNIAVTDLRQSNEFYSEIEGVLDIIFMKSILRVKAFEVQNSRKFDFYNRMFEKSLTIPESLTEKEVINFMNGICLTDNKVDPFKIQMLDNEVEERLKKNFSLKLAARMALVYLSQGVKNSSEKWLKICRDGIWEKMTPRELDAVSFMSLLIIDENYDQKLDFLSFVLEDRIKFFGTSFQVLLFWRLCSYKEEDSFLKLKKIIFEILSEKKISDFKKLDLIILSQITQTKRPDYAYIPEKISEFMNKDKKFENQYIKFFSKIVSSDPTLTTTNASKAISKLGFTLQRSNISYQKNIIFSSEEKKMGFLPVFTAINKSAYFVYNDYLFLKNLRISQDEHMDFKYGYVISRQRPEFLRRNEEILETDGIEVKFWRLRDFENMSFYADSELVGGVEDLIDRKRLEVMGLRV